MSEKYPRTLHLPFSPGATKDDKMHAPRTGLFCGMPIIVTEKVDGSNVCLERNCVFARSHQGAPVHPSFDALKAFHASVSFLIPDHLQIFGEWCWARHSITYTHLPHYLLLFGVRNVREKHWLNWNAVAEWADTLGCATTPLLDWSIAKDDVQFRALIERHAAQQSKIGECREGVVVRFESGFPDSEFAACTAKWVRAMHVQTTDHWTNQKIQKNLLAQV